MDTAGDCGSPYLDKENCRHLENVCFPVLNKEPSRSAHLGSTFKKEIYAENEVHQELLRLQNQLINEQENALAWERECQRVTEQGKLLYSSYIARCNRLKHMTAQLEVSRAKARGMEETSEAIQQKHKAEIDEWKHKYMDLAGRFKQNFAFYKELEAEHEGLRSEHSQLLEASGRDSEDLRKAQTQLRDAQKRIIDLEGAVRVLENRVSQEVPASNFAKVLEAKEAEILKLRETLEETQGLCTQLNQEKQKEAEEKLSLQAQVASLRQQRIELVEELQTARNSVEMEDLPDVPVTFTALMKAPRPSLDGTMESMNITNELLREENSNLQKEVALLEESKGALQTSLSDFELQVEQLQNQIKQRDERIVLLSATLESAVASQASEDSDVLKKEQEVLRRSLFESQEEVDVLRTRLSETARILSSVEKAKEKSDGLVSSLELQLEDLKGINKKMQDDMRIMYRKHKKEVETLAEQFKHDNYKARYAQVALENVVLQKRQTDLCAREEGMKLLSIVNRSLAAVQQESSTELLSRAQAIAKSEDCIVTVTRRLLRMLSLQQEYRNYGTGQHAELLDQKERYQRLEEILHQKESFLLRERECVAALSEKLAMSQAALQLQQTESRSEQERQASLLHQDLNRANKELQQLRRQRDEEHLLALQNEARCHELEKELLDMKALLEGVQRKQLELDASLDNSLHKAQEECENLLLKVSLLEKNLEQATAAESCALREQRQSYQAYLDNERKLDAALRIIEGLKEESSNKSALLSQTQQDKEDLEAEVHHSQELILFAENEHSLYQEAILSQAQTVSSLQELLSQFSEKELSTKEQVELLSQSIVKLEGQLAEQLDTKSRLEEQLASVQDRHLAVVQALEAQQNLTHMSESASQQSLVRLRAMSERCDSLVLHNRRLLCEIHSLTNRLQQADKTPSVVGEPKEASLSPAAKDFPLVHHPNTSAETERIETTTECRKLHEEAQDSPERRTESSFSTPKSSKQAIRATTPHNLPTQTEGQSRIFPVTPTATEGQSNVALRIQQLRQQCREIFAASQTLSTPGQEKGRDK